MKYKQRFRIFFTDVPGKHVIVKVRPICKRLDYLSKWHYFIDGAEVPYSTWMVKSKQGACSASCSPGDFHQHGKCGRNGCI